MGKRKWEVGEKEVGSMSEVSEKWVCWVGVSGGIKVEKGQRGMRA
jgi:hypothetical protein